MNLFDASDELPILIEGDGRLRVAANEVTALDDQTRVDVRHALATLTAFRRRHGFGRALAAPQLGISRRLVAVDLGAGPFTLFNPEIVWRSAQTFEVWDDCFSVPDELVRVLRHRSVSLTYRDEAFRERRWEQLPSDLAELLQHEVDHLDGILMTDRAHGADAVRPASERAALVDAARPQRRLSLDRIAEASRCIDPVFRDTPQFLSEPLSQALGCSLTLKVETLNPIRSFKGRGADFFVTKATERLGSRSLVCASAGNLGQGLAFACRKHGLPLTIFAARNANLLKVERMRALGADVRLEGESFDVARDAAKAWAASAGAVMVEDGVEPEISEGAGSIGVELLSRGDALDEVVVPLGDGALLNGIARWIKAASPAARVVGVCAAGAPAMAESWRKGPGGALVSHSSMDTIADGIAVSTPIPVAVADMHGVVDEVLLVTDADLLEAMRLAHRHTGLVLEPAGAAGLAAIVAEPARFAGRSVATILTGGNVTPEQARAWLAP